MSDATHDAHDQLIDLGLRETLGGESPPDLTERILARVENPPQPRKPAMSGSTARVRRWLAYALAASVLFCLGVLARPAIDSSTGLLVLSDPQPADSQPPTNAKPAGPVDSELDLLVSTVQELPADVTVTESEISESQSGPAEPDKGKRSLVGVGVNSDAGVVGQVLADEETWEELTDRVPPTGTKEVPVERARLALAESLATHDRPTQDLDGDGVSPQGVDATGRERYPYLSGTTFGVDAILTTGDSANPKRQAYAYNRSAGPPIQHGFGDGRAVPVPDHVDPDVYLWMVTRNGRETYGESAGATPDQLNRQKNELFEKKVQGQGPDASGDKYQPIHENPFIAAEGLQALSTFSIDVDTASYANVRQFLTSGRMPPPDAVRLEELVNYFDYGYAGPEVAVAGEAGEDKRASSSERLAPSPRSTEEAASPSRGGGHASDPFAAHVEVAGCPWNATHRLVRIGIKGRELAADKRPLSNLVFLIDVSGSMQDPNKLPLVIEGMKALTQQLGENDRVAIVVYASTEGLALPSTPGDQQETILAALDKLTAGGSTAGGAGIQLAYQIAEDHFIEGGANRVILCTDGDFNVGTTSTGDLERMVTQKAKDTGVFLSVCGFGRGNLNDAMMETISNKGNGTYYYIDTEREAEKVFVRGLTGTLVTIAKDVKIQVEFNPNQVAAYRLLGYENRVLAAQDFNDDKKDAGEIGAGHTVTALYEIVPAGQPAPTPELDDLRYQKPAEPLDGDVGDELLTLKMRYKLPDEDHSTKREWPVSDDGKPFGQASPDMQFASAAAGFGMLLRGSAYSGDLTWEAVREIAQPGVGEDPHGYRKEFLTLVDQAARLRPTPQPTPPTEADERDNSGSSEE